MYLAVGLVMYVIGWYVGRKQATRLLDSMSYRVAKIQAQIDQELSKLEDIKKIFG